MRRTRARLPIALATMAALLVVTLVQPHTALAQDTDCFVLGDDIVVEAGEVRDCSVLVGKGDVIVLDGGAIEGDVAVAGGDAEIAGIVNGNVWASGDIVLLDTADVSGDVIAVGDVESVPGAHVGGRIGRVQGIDEAVEDTVGDDAVDTSLSSEESAALSIGFVVVLVVLATLFAALATILAPRAVGNVRGALSAGPARSLFVGLVALIAGPFIHLILLPVFPLIPVVTFAYLLLAAIGSVGLSEWFGRRLASGARRPVQAATGAAVLTLVLSVGYAIGSQVSYGWLLSAITMLLQFALASLATGAALLTLLGTKPWPRQDEPGDAALVTLPGLSLSDGPDADAGADLTPDGDAADAAAIGAAAVAAAAYGDEPTAGADAPTAAMAALPSAGAEDAGVAEDEDDDQADEDVGAAAAAAGAKAADAATSDEESNDEPASGEVDDRDAPDEPTPGWGPTDPGEVPGGGIDEATGPADAGAGMSDEEPQSESGAPEPERAEAPPTAAEAQAGGPPAPKAVGIGDVHGISPIYAHLLKAGGIGDLGALAAADPEAIAEMVSAPGVSPVDAATAAGWVQQARELLA